MDKLSAGIVITGGGALLKDLPQLVNFRSGMDVRVGFPNERLDNDSTGEINHPMYSTSVGLLLNGHDILMGLIASGKNKLTEDYQEFVSPKKPGIPESNTGKREEEQEKIQNEEKKEEKEEEKIARDKKNDADEDKKPEKTISKIFRRIVDNFFIEDDKEFPNDENKI
jgi:cell division protein FtsA